MTRRQWAANTLQIPLQATDDQARQAYRDLVQVWHPDKFQKNDRLHQKAEQAMRDINLAYDIWQGKDSTTEIPGVSDDPPVHTITHSTTRSYSPPPSANTFQYVQAPMPRRSGGGGVIILAIIAAVIGYSVAGPIGCIVAPLLVLSLGSGAFSGENACCLLGGCFALNACCSSIVLGALGILALTIGSLLMLIR